MEQPERRAMPRGVHPGERHARLARAGTTPKASERSPRVPARGIRCHRHRERPGGPLRGRTPSEGGQEDARHRAPRSPGRVRARFSAEEVHVRRGRPSDRRLRGDGESPGRAHRRPAPPVGVRDRCTFLKVDPFYTAVFPGFRLAAPLGVEDFLAAHARHFPREASGLRRILDLCAALNREVREFPSELSLWDVVRMPRRFPRLLRYHKATLGSVLDAHLDDPRLKALFAALWPYLGLPPSRLSFVYWSVMLQSFLEEGAFYCQGSFQRLADAFVEGLQTHGGELLLRSAVRRIVVKDGRIAGVVLENGQRIQAPVVISNADARQTFEELIGEEKLPRRFVNNVKRMRPSLSAFVMYLATDLDLRQLDGHHEMFFYRSWSHDETYRQVVAGQPSGLSISVPTLVDPSLAPVGEHLIIATTLIPYDLGASWRTEKVRY